MQKSQRLNKAMAKNTVRSNKKYFPQGFVTAFALAACGKETTKETTPVVEIETVEPVVVSPNDILTPVLMAGVNYSSPSNNSEIISTTYNILKTISKITDVNTADADIIDVSTDQNVVATPTISGFELLK